MPEAKRRQLTCAGKRGIAAASGGPNSGNIAFELRHFEPFEVISEQNTIQKRLDNLKHKEERIKASYREGIDTLEEYRDNKKLLQEERERLESQLKKLSHKDPESLAVDPSSEILEKARNVYSILKSDKYTTAQKNEALKQIIDKIIFDRKNETLKIYYYYQI